MNTNDMRSLMIYGDQAFQAVDALNKLESWRLCENNNEGNSHFLEKGDTKIYVRFVANNIAHTVNVLPQDLQGNSIDLKDDALLDLERDLRKANIEFNLNISENDKNKLLNSSTAKVG